MGNAPRKSYYPKNIPSSGSGTKKVHWEGPGLPAAPGKPILIPGTEETQPDVVAIRWERSPSNGGSAIIGYLVEHRKLGSPNWIRSAPILCTFPEMTLSGLGPGWRYQFRIRAQNALGLSEPSEISDPLTVTLQRATAASPYFELELEDTIALENEQAEFQVKYTGIPTPKISWFKDGFEIFSSRRTRIITENGKSNLLIHRTALDDEGSIKCTATNRAGHVSTKARLMLEAPPRIRLPRQYEDGLLFKQDETIRLKVSFAGRPLPEVTWYHDGEIIKRNERHIFESMDSESILKIRDAKRVDRGEYSVKAINKLGEDIASFLVTVTDRPSPPGKTNVTMTLGRSVTLSWTEPKDDGGCKIGTYIVEYYRVGWDMWLKAATCRQTTTTLSELIVGSEYRFRIKAENPYGVSDPSEESDKVFIPDLKRGVTGPLMSGKSQSHREIHRGRSEKQGISFVEPTQRTRSLTREEACSGGGPVVRSVSSQRLISAPARSSRADNRVTFASKLVQPVKEFRCPSPRQKSKDEVNTEESRRIKLISDLCKEEANLESAEHPSTTVVITPSFNDSGGRLPIPEQKTGSSYSSEGSPAPPESPRIHEPRSQTTLLSAERNHPSPPKILHSTLRGETNFSYLSTKNESATFDVKRRNFANSEPASLADEDDNMLHGSSEIMLVLYPEEKRNRELERIPYNTTTAYDRKTNHTDMDQTKSQASTSFESEGEDFVVPPMSLSLPELFSMNHQIIEIMREAVSSTELLHERAMERFYRAVAFEEATSDAQRKAREERSVSESWNKKDLTSEATSERYALFQRRTSLRRKISNSGASWQAKRDRRRSSDSQTDTFRVPFKLPAAVISHDVASDPNLSSKGLSETQIFEPWDSTKDALQLRRWHETEMNLSAVRKIHSEVGTHSKEIEISFNNNNQVMVERNHMETIETKNVANSIISSEESSDDDLKQFRARIIAIPIVNEEDTYHPRGRPVPHISPDLPPSVPPHKIPIVDIIPPLPDRVLYLAPSPPISPPNIAPKSILKKRVAKEVIPVNQFGRPIPPEKPVEIVRPQEDQGIVTLRKKSLPILSDHLSEILLSESDIDNENVLSAAEVARSRRRQMKQLSKTSTTSSDGEEEREEERMAVVSHYTEIVKEYSMTHSPLSLRKQVTSNYFRTDNQIKDDRKETENSTIISKMAAARTLSPSREKSDYSPDKKLIGKTPDRCDALSNKSYEEKKRKEPVEDKERDETGQSTSRKNNVNSRITIPNNTIKDTKRRSRPPSRQESPASRSRNVSSGRGTTPRSSSETGQAGVPGEYANRKVVDRSIGGHKISRPSSRSNSRDGTCADTPTEVKMERLQRALKDRKHRSRRNSTNHEESNRSSNMGYHVNTNNVLAIKAENNVRLTVGYVTDLILLMAAIYVYLFKREILAIPIIALLLYRRIQQGIRGLILEWLRGPNP